MGKLAALILFAGLVQAQYIPPAGGGGGGAPSGAAGGSLAGTYPNPTIGTLGQNLIFTDATYDIGASGATRPRDLFISRNLNVPGTATIGTMVAAIVGTPTATGMTGFLVGQPEPDLSTANGAGNSISVMNQGSGINAVNFLHAGDGTPFYLTSYNSAGTVAAPDNVDFGGVISVYDFNGYIYSTNQWNYVGGMAWQCFSLTNCRIYFDTNGGQFRLQDDNNNARMGLHPLSTTEAEINDGTSVAEGGALVQLDGAAFKGAAYIGSGSTPAVSGCGAIGTGSTNPSGFITSATTGACASVLTFTATAPVGWSCAISNATTANLIRQTGSSTTSATFTGATVSGDVLRYACIAY